MRLALVVAATLGLSTQAVAEEPSEETGIIPSLSFEGDSIVLTLLNTTDETVELLNSLATHEPNLPPMIEVKFAHCEPLTVEDCLRQANGNFFRIPHRYPNWIHTLGEPIVLEPGQSQRRSWPLSDFDDPSSGCLGAHPCLVFAKYTSDAIEAKYLNKMGSTETPWVLRTP